MDVLREIHDQLDEHQNVRWSFPRSNGAIVSHAFVTDISFGSYPGSLCHRNSAHNRLGFNSQVISKPRSQH